MFSKKEYAKRKLTEAILAGEFEPGESLRQNDIAARYELSSTPVREAFSELQMAGVLAHEPHRGFHVAMVDKTRVNQIFQVRNLIETKAARLAVDHVTDDVLAELQALLEDMERQRNQDDFLSMVNSNDDFHRLVFSLSGNDFMVRLIEQLWASYPRFAAWAMKERRMASLQEHHVIFEALQARDVKALTNAYTTHLRNGKTALINFLAEQAEQTKEPENDG